MTTDRVLYGIEDDPVRMRQLAETAVAEADVLHGVLDRLEVAGLLGPTNAGPKLRTRLELAANRLEEIAHFARRRAERAR